MPRVALGVGVLAQAFALDLQKQNEPPLKFPLSENIRLTFLWLRNPGNECAGVWSRAGRRSMHCVWDESLLRLKTKQTDFKAVTARS
jgi:hypothetical protein